jgi:hypothetical protein
VKHDTARVHVANHLAHMIGRERIAQMVVAHARSRGVGHLGSLQVEAGVGEGAKRAGMIVVQVRDDQLADVSRRDAEHLERCSRRAGDLPSALCPLGFVEAAVDQQGAVGVADHPDEIVDRVRKIVVVGGNEAFEAATVGELAVLDGQDLVGLGRHGCAPPVGLPFRMASI